MKTLGTGLTSTAPPPPGAGKKPYRRDVIANQIFPQHVDKFVCGRGHPRTSPGGGDSQEGAKRPLLCARRAQRHFLPVMNWYTRRAESWPRPASLAAARQFTFSRPTIPVCNGIVFSGRAMRAPTRSKRQTARRAAKSPARDARAPSLPYLANILTAQGHYLRSIFTPFFAAAINASTSSLVLNGANDTRMALSVRALGRPSARSTPLCLPLEHAEPLDT